MSEGKRRKSEMLSYVGFIEQMKTEGFILKFSQVGVKYGNPKDGW